MTQKNVSTAYKNLTAFLGFSSTILRQKTTTIERKNYTVLLQFNRSIEEIICELSLLYGVYGLIILN